MLSAIAIVLVLGILIFFHEFGHFSVAKAFGMGVRTFSLGFGKKIAGFKRGQTEYKISVVPLGGYVHLVGENPGEDLPKGFSAEESFSRRPPWQRMLVVAAGPIFNFLLAWIIYLGIFLVVGQQALLPQIGQVQKDTPAQEAGLQSGDRIVEINGAKIDYWHELAEHIRQNKGEALLLTVSRERSLIDIQVKPEIQTTENIFGEKIEVPRIGIVAAQETVYIDMGPLDAAWSSLVQTWNLIKLTFEGLIKIIERVVPLKTIGGPIMIAQLVSSQAQQGFVDVLALTALISINLGLLNLLPIPVLDGGHIIFFGLETILRRPLDPKWRDIAIRVGLTLLIALMALAVYNDLYRIMHTK
jgi:regulator of sigma E protease